MFTADIQRWIYHYGFLLQSLQRDPAIQGWIAKILKTIRLHQWGKKKKDAAESVLCSCSELFLVTRLSANIFC